MKNIYKTIFFFSSATLLQATANAQCGSPLPEGTATNMFTHVRNSTNPVAADKNLNTVIFIHRNNVALNGGNSGNLRYDISTDAGSTWAIDLGVLNPLSTNYARYPNVAIYNPPANTATANAYLGYLAATIDPSSSGWNGMVTGVRKLNGTGNTENYNQPVVSPTGFIPNSLVKGAPGVYWAIDGPPNTYSNSVNSFYIYKGTWNGSNDITWSTNFSVTPPSNLMYNGLPHISDYNIAFDPTGTYGWISFLGHLNTGPAGYAFYPCFYRTVNGGATWTGPIQVDLNQFSCMTSNIATGNIVTANGEHDLAVDMYGNPHLLTAICNGFNGYSMYYTQWHHMFDITMSNNIWIAQDLANVNAGRGSWGTSPNIVTMDMAPQVSRSANGAKIFFSWTDNAAYALGAANQTPDLFSVGFDVQQHKLTNIKNFSSCNTSTSGKIFFPHIAEEALEPATGTYKLAAVYGEYSTPANDPAVTANFKFLNNATFTSPDFSITPGAAPVNIVQGDNLLICPGSTLNLTLNGTYGQILWSNGNTTNLNPITSAGTYSVLAMLGCNIGIDSISVTSLTLGALSVSGNVCPGGSVTLNASGNANSYTWLPDGISGTVAVVNPTASTVYTLSAAGDQNCTGTATIAAVVYPLPTVAVSGNTTVCKGSVVTETASGAATYVWSTGTAAGTETFSPASNTSYTVIGTDANGCKDTVAISIAVKPVPNVTASSTKTMICKGESVTLTASGASTYSWNNSAITSTITVSPNNTTTYSVTGTNTVGCSTNSVITQYVDACTGIKPPGQELMSLLIYPNPTNGAFVIATALLADNAVIEIYNGLGQKITGLPVKDPEMEINLSGQANGIYFVNVMQDGKLCARSKIVKQ